MTRDKLEEQLIGLFTGVLMEGRWTHDADSFKAGELSLKAELQKRMVIRIRQICKEVLPDPPLPIPSANGAKQPEKARQA